MSTTYPEFSFSNYPNQTDSFEYMSDVTTDMYPYIEQYKNFYANKNMTACANLLTEHPEINSCLMNAEKYNKLIDAIKASQKFYTDNIYTYLQNIVVYKGEYNGSMRYTKYNTVLYNEEFYMCISDSSIGTLPTSTDAFIKLTLRGEKGIGIGLSFEGEWNPSITYNSNSAVTYNNCLYASKGDNLGKTPSNNSSYWNLIFDLKIATNYDNSTSGSSATTMQGALDDLYSKTNNNTNSINNNVSAISALSSNINSITTKLEGIESGAEANTVLGIKGSSEESYRTGLINITPSNLGITVINNTADANKSVNYANSAGSAINATNSTNAINATNANYATSSGNSDTIDGYHIQSSTTDLIAGTSQLGTNILYFVYE